MQAADTVCDVAGDQRPVARSPQLLKGLPPRSGEVQRPVLLHAAQAFDLLMLPLLVLTFLLPARLVFPPLGAAGRPAVLYAAGLGIVWLFFLVRRAGLPPRRQPVRWLMGVFLFAQLATYALGFDRGLPPIEARSADRWLLLCVSVSGLALFVADAPRRAALDRLLRRVVLGAACMAVVGSLQFLLRLDLTTRIQVPGLAANRDLIGIGERGFGFARVAGTATHYIEFGVVLGMVLPLAIHYAFFGPTRAARIRRWCLVALIAGAVPFSVSRSGVVAVAVSSVVLSAVWPWRLRLNALVAAGVAVVAYRLIQPGLLGTIKSLFTRADDDPSVQARTEDYAVVADFFQDRMWFGRGAGTFMPERYILLDNQMLNTLVSQGVLGLGALVILFGGAYWTARRTRLRGVDEQTRHLGQALAASIATAFVASFTFDSLSFSTFTCLLFVLIGAAGALLRTDGATEMRPLQRADAEDRHVASPWMASARGGQQ